MSTLKVGAIQSTTGNAAITVPNAGGIGVASIKSTTGNNALTVAADGVMTTSVKHAFYMYRSSFQNINHATGFNLIQFDATRINEGNGVTLGSSARYTVPSGADGIYVLHAKGRLESGTDGNASIQMRLNGTAIATTYYYHEYYDGMSVNMLRNLSAGDYVDVGITNSIGVNVNVGGADAGDVLYFHGYRLG